MYYIIIALICIISIIILKISFNIKFKIIKQLEMNVLPKELENIDTKFPEDKEICEDILKKFNNNNVEIKIDNNYSNCLYTVFNNKITIGKFKQNYMKIQTIAHECIHSCQFKTTLWFNFIFTNIFLLYFAIISFLAILNKLQNTEIVETILIFMSFIQSITRNNLETEAMTKAKYVAKEYIEEKGFLNIKEKESLLKEYDRVNSIGIPFINYYTITMNLIKIILFSLIVFI